MGLKQKDRAVGIINMKEKKSNIVYLGLFKLNRVLSFSI